MTYTLRYARVVILEREIEVPDDAGNTQGLAEVIAMNMEAKGELGIADIVAKPGSEVVDIHDYDAIWEVEEDEAIEWEEIEL